jgi:hypothetical protein
VLIRLLRSIVIFVLLRQVIPDDIRGERSSLLPLDVLHGPRLLPTRALGLRIQPLLTSALDVPLLLLFAALLLCAAFLRAR